MAKVSGLGATISIDDSGGTARDISNDITSFTISTPRGVQDTTGVDKSAMERLLLLADVSMDFTGVVNTAANQSHAVFSTVPSTSVARTTSVTVASQILAPELLFTDYQLQRPQSGELTFTAPGVLADGTVPTWTT